MARLFGIIGNRPDLTAKVLAYEGEALKAQSKGTPLGWGLGFYQGDEVLMRRRPIDEREQLDVAKLAADVRAGTPSLAGKLVVPDHAATVRELDELLHRATAGLRSGAERGRQLVELLWARPALADPHAWVAARRQPVDLLGDRLRRAPALRLERDRVALDRLHDRLRLLGPAATLERGYAIVQQPDGGVVRNAAELAPGGRIGVRLAAGRVAATVDEVEAG